MILYASSFILTGWKGAAKLVAQLGIVLSPLAERGRLGSDNFQPQNYREMTRE
jgi:hypothetical protein